MHDPASPDIKQLVDACLRNDRLAQKALYQMLYGKLLSVTMRYADGRDDAKAILNLAFLKIFQELPKFDCTKTFFPWAKQITLHTAIDQLRQRTNYHKHMQQLGEMRTGSNLSWNDALNLLAVEEIYSFVQQLPEAGRTVFSLFEIEGYQHSEIAEMLGISEGTSRWHLAEAKRRLRTMLAPFFKIHANVA